MMTGADPTKRSSGGLLDLSRASDPLPMVSPSMTSSERMDFIRSSLIEIPPPGYLGSLSTYDPALDTYIHSGLWQTPSIRERLASLSSAQRRCRACANTFHSTDGSRSGRTSQRRTQPKSRARKTTMTSTASDISSLRWMNYLILRWSIGLAPLLIWRPQNSMLTSMQNLKKLSSDPSPAATDPAGTHPQSGEEEV